MDRSRPRPATGGPAPVLVPGLVPVLVLAALLGATLVGPGCARHPEAPASSGAPVEAAPAPTEPSAGEPEAPAPAALPDFDDPSWTRTPSRMGGYLVCWRNPEGRIPRNEDFTLEVWLLREGALAGEAFLTVRAWMPDHGHGMLRQPRAERRPDGSFVVPGMLLHMRGHWQLFFEILEGNLAETAECDLHL